MFWFTLLAVVHVIVCIFLVAIVLMQAAKGHGLAGAFGSFGGGVAQNLFGAQAGDVLTKATSIAAVTFVVTSLTLAVFSAKRSSSIMDGGKTKAKTEKVSGVDKEVDAKALSQEDVKEKVPAAEKMGDQAVETVTESAAASEEMPAPVTLPATEETPSPVTLPAE